MVCFQVFGTSKINQILPINVGFVHVLQSIKHIILCGQIFGVWGIAGMRISNAKRAMETISIGEGKENDSIFIQ